MSHFFRNGNQFNVAPSAAIDLYDELPVGTYTVKLDPMTGYYLEMVSDFDIEGKLYGSTPRDAERIIRTWGERQKDTGVMLAGEKGSGKTLLAKKLSVEAHKQGMPTLIINQPLAGEAFNIFMQNIEQPTVVIFDEFEKVYNEKPKQEQLLTLLDGVYPSNKLFVITCNDRYRINEHMLNRPGRLFYRLDYKGLETDFIIEYCEDNLQNKEHIDAVCRAAFMFSQFNFDILKAMVEEMNRYNETPQQAMKILNAKPEASADSQFDVSLFVDGKPAKLDHGEEKWFGNPLSSGPYIDFLPEPSGEADEDAPMWAQAIFQTTDLKDIDIRAGKFMYTNKLGQQLWLNKTKPEVSTFVY